MRQKKQIFKLVCTMQKFTSISTIDAATELSGSYTKASQLLKIMVGKGIVERAYSGGSRKRHYGLVKK